MISAAQNRRGAGNYEETAVTHGVQQAGGGTAVAMSAAGGKARDSSGTRGTAGREREGSAKGSPGRAL